MAVIDNCWAQTSLQGQIDITKWSLRTPKRELNSTELWAAACKWLGSNHNFKIFWSSLPGWRIPIDQSRCQEAGGGMSIMSWVAMHSIPTLWDVQEALTNHGVTHDPIVREGPSGFCAPAPSWSQLTGLRNQLQKTRSVWFLGVRFLNSHWTTSFGNNSSWTITNPAIHRAGYWSMPIIQTKAPILLALQMFPRGGEWLDPWPPNTNQQKGQQVSTLGHWSRPVRFVRKEYVGYRWLNLDYNHYNHY